MKLNRAAVMRAKGLIAAAKINESPTWSFDSADRKALLKAVDDDWAEYGKRFLGINEDAGEETFDRFHYPYGKGDEVWRQGVISVKGRAAQNKEDDIASAADSLLQAIDDKLAEENKSMSTQVERRVLPMQLRAVTGEKGEMIVEGYAIVYGKEANIWGDIEVIQPGAATRALETKDQYYMWQHDDTEPLAAVEIGTLEIKEDEEGVFIRAQFLDTQSARDRFLMIKSGLVRKQSFAFWVEPGGDKWDKVIRDGVERWRRTIAQFAAIPEFSAVTFPAYADTTLQARAIELAKRSKPQSEPASADSESTSVLEVMRDAARNVEARRKLLQEEMTQ